MSVTAEALVRDSRLIGHLSAFVDTLSGLDRQVTRMLNVDPELAPELVAMRVAVSDGIAAADRAVKFLGARMDTA